MTDAPAKLLLRALRGEALPVPPIWMMRQAGRYLPEYRATRAKAGDFLSLCYTPDLAAEVTLQPIRRYGFDAAILFADILLVPQALGLDLWFVTGEGPRLSPISDAAAGRSHAAASRSRVSSACASASGEPRVPMRQGVSGSGFIGPPSR